MTAYDRATPAPRSIHWLLFDYGGVLAEEGFHDTLAELSAAAGYPRGVLPSLAMDAVYESGYVTGQGSEADFWQLLRKRFPLRQGDAWLSGEILRRFTLRPAMLGLIDALRAHGYRTAILSDQTDWLDRLEQRDGFFRHFDRIFNSYHLGYGKRDAATFERVLEALAVLPAQAIFIDDNPDNVRRAQSRGLYGLRFVDVETLCRELTALLGIKLTPRIDP
jgi:putative hydrolase of the HAD superfamily